MSPLNKQERKRMQKYCRILRAEPFPEALTPEGRKDITQMLGKMLNEETGVNEVESKYRELNIDLNTIEALLKKEGLVEKGELIIDAEIKLLKKRYFIVLKLIPKGVE